MGCRASTGRVRRFCPGKSCLVNLLLRFRDPEAGRNLQDAPILILDEATSALDSKVEGAIQRTLYGMMEGKTVIAIAHRLSTLARMDRIVVLDQGRIVEDGSHTALLASGGIHADLWAHQSGGFLGDASSEAAQ